MVKWKNKNPRSPPLPSFPSFHANPIQLQQVPLKTKLSEIRGHRQWCNTCKAVQTSSSHQKPTGTSSPVPPRWRSCSQTWCVQGDSAESPSNPVSCSLEPHGYYKNSRDTIAAISFSLALHGPKSIWPWVFWEPRILLWANLLLLQWTQSHSKGLIFIPKACLAH